MMTKSLLSACAIALFSFASANASNSVSNTATCAASASTIVSDALTTADTNDKIGESIDFYYNIPAHSACTWTYTFRAKAEARVIVDGDGDTDLDVYILDEDNNLILSDRDYMDPPYCTWTPKRTSKYKIKVVNTGNVYNRCRIQIP